jgi:CDP-diacylglycerol--serine O-phosphatidyltransferase
MLFWQEKPAFGLTSKDVNVLTNAQDYRTQLLRLISNAKKRIYITALYLQDDEAGREILEVLHRVSLTNPALEIKVLVDFHRAQRGLIGADKSDGNASLYCDYLEKFKSNVQVYGVPVKAKELFGVLHLKGFVIDDILLYSGASLNNVYLQFNERYRLDRYFLVAQAQLCDSVVDFIESTLLSSVAVPRIDTRPLKRLIDFRVEQKQLMRDLKAASYKSAEQHNTQSLGIRLFLGFGIVSRGKLFLGILRRNTN